MLNRGASGEVWIMRTFLHGLFARLGPPTDGDPGDDQLLAAFIASRDESAFQQIVRRHGPMVQGVCRRVLRNEADADDAFQAVFVVFLRKASSVRPGNLLGNWLYGVAVNVARKGRELNARRKMHETQANTPVTFAPGSPETGDLREVIDQELSRLPADYRAAVVVCDLEGRTRKEAAGQLGWSEGTVASRLARARSILANRLTRRGLAMPAAGIAAALGVGSPLSAAVPRVAFTGHTEAIEALARETVKAMTMSNLKATVAVMLAVAGVVGTGAVLACGGYGPGPTVPPVTAAKSAPDRSIEARIDENPLAAWSKPAAGDDFGTDKPASGNAGGTKPTRFILQNPSRDITIVTDRDEKFVEFFRRQRVLIAGVTEKDRDTASAAKSPVDRVFVDNASYNESGVMKAVYGSYIRLAPVSHEIAELIFEMDPVAFVLVQDAREKDVWRIVGVTGRSSVGFFASKDKKGTDDFAPVDLQFTPKK
jgi:RNA polymerase sigma factor (sigma-70 family)